MLKVSWTVGLLALACGCGDNLSPDVTTRTQVIPNMTGDAMAYVLEPLLITPIDNAWTNQPNAYTETGPAMLVDLASHERIGTFAVGMTHVTTGARTAWVLQSTSAEWYGSTPAAEPTPRTMRMSVMDRTTLQLGRQVMLDPPIDTPVVISGKVGNTIVDELLDVSRPDAPDHEITVRLRYDNGNSLKLVDDKGTAPIWCNGQNHLVYAYKVPTEAVRVRKVGRTQVMNEVSTIWGSDYTDLGHTSLGTAGIACDTVGKTVVFEAFDPDRNEPYLAALDLETKQATFSLAGLSAPFAISTDGSAIVARRSSDDRFVLVRPDLDHANILELDLYASRRTLPQPVQVGDQALFSTGDEYHVVDMSTGKVSAALEITGVDTVRAIPWADANGFALMRTHGVEMTAVGFADATGVMPMDLPPFVRDPQLLAASGSRMYIAVSTDTGLRQVYGFDRSSHDWVSKGTPPECNSQSIGSSGSCL